MSRKKKTPTVANVATTDAKTYKAMERHSTKKYIPEVDAQGNVVSMNLPGGTDTITHKVPTHRDAAGFWVYREVAPGENVFAPKKDNVA